MAVTGLTCMSPLLLLLAFVLLVDDLGLPTVNGNAHLVHRRFEYKYSFKPPYLAQKDGTVPFWEYGGNAIASSENVRIAPSLRSQKGAIWTKQKTNFDWWEVDVVFRVSGRGRIGADGLAFWYTAEKGDYTGEVFGSSDKWFGLGIFFDSFDNDNKHNNPYISAVLNDGTKKFDHQNDGATQLLSGCLRDFRNKPFPTRAKIEYYSNILTVLFHNGMTNNDQDYEMCFRAENVLLPKNGYFGVSAATGGLADDHDVFHFLTTSLHVPGEIKSEVPQDQDQAKLTQEYQDYQKKLDQQKEEYKKENPDTNTEDLENWYEDSNARELRQIWEAQTATHDQLRSLSSKLDEVIGRQERTLGLLSVSAQGGAPPPQAQHAGQAVPQITAGSGGIQRHEVDALLQNQNVMAQTVREIRSIIGEVHARADSILTNQARAPTAQIQGGGYDVQSLIHEMRDSMNQVKQGVAGVTQRLQQPNAQANVQCPTQNCVSMTAFLVTIVVHLLVIVGYNMYKDSRDSQAKKFY
ncbi:protein ERGIC-53 [Toxorhynchites rutilus septentrionalis]|uniref:protein ERGIC-53 n=1 Tax=Toxorhynchites rutilus septentrionalis TaxID=329112 RepID=UPI00247B0FEC|nr:protein ERGIC-53 [Toxorhynchites rutilus septentrionalis]XP_055620383.1 protein ERGIC-53 [Toxorhynchites rutilus septentrionalis]